MKRISNQKTSLITIYLPHLFTTTKFCYITIPSSFQFLAASPHYFTSPCQRKGMTLPHPPGAVAAAPLLVVWLLPQPHLPGAVDAVPILVVPLPQVPHLPGKKLHSFNKGGATDSGTGSTTDAGSTAPTLSSGRSQGTFNTGSAASAGGLWRPSRECLFLNRLVEKNEGRGSWSSGCC